MTSGIVFLAEHVLQPCEIVAAVIVVLRNDGEFGVRILRQRIARIEPRLVAERRLHAHGGLRKLRDVGEFRGAGAEEQLRDVLALQIFRDRGVMGGADRGEDQRDLVAFDQPPRLLHRLRRRVAVVERDQIDLAAVDAAALVDHLEIADLALAERTERRDRPAIGHGLADLDFGCGDAAHFGRHRGGRQHQTSDGAQRANSRDETHRLPSPVSSAALKGARSGRYWFRRAETCHGAAADANPNHGGSDRKGSAASAAIAASPPPHWTAATERRSDGTAR